MGQHLSNLYSDLHLLTATNNDGWEWTDVQDAPDEQGARGGSARDELGGLEVAVHQRAGDDARLDLVAA